MIYLTWSILNTIIGFYLIYLIIGFLIIGKKFFNKRFKIISIVILLIGIIQIMFTNNSGTKTNKIILNEHYTSKNNTIIKEITLENHLAFDIKMLLKYSIVQDKYVPIESNSFLVGFISGYNWEIKSIDSNNTILNKENDFIVKGILKWNLFGINLYNEPKTFNVSIE